MDERAQLVRAVLGVTPEDGSKEGAPVLELIEQLVLGKPLVDSLQEPMPVMKRLEQAILATASVWEPLEHLHRVVSDDVDFDSFWMAPWDAGGTLCDSCRLCVAFWRTLLRSVIRLSCRLAIVDGLNMDMGLTDALAVGHNPDMNMKIKTESPRLAVTPGEWYTSDLLATMSTGFRQMENITNVIGAVKLDCRTVWGFPQIDSAAVGGGAVELNDMYFRRTSFPQIDSCTVSSGVVELDDMNFRRMSFPPDKFSVVESVVWKLYITRCAFHSAILMYSFQTTDFRLWLDRTASKRS